MSFISRVFRCQACYELFDKLVPRSEDTGVTRCPECGNMAEKQITAPNMLKASYHDGKDRGDSYRKLKEAAKLEREMYNKPPEKRGDLRQEIKKLKRSER